MLKEDFLSFKKINRLKITLENNVANRFKEKNDIKESFGLNYRFDFFGDLLDYDWSYQ